MRAISKAVGLVLRKTAACSEIARARGDAPKVKQARIASAGARPAMPTRRDAARQHERPVSEDPAAKLLPACVDRPICVGGGCTWRQTDFSGTEGGPSTSC